MLDCGENAGVCIANDSPIPAGAVAAAAPLDHVCGNLGSGCSSPGVISETTGCTLALCAAFPKLVYDEKRRIGTYLGFAPGSFVLLPWAPTAGMVLKYFRDEFSGGFYTAPACFLPSSTCRTTCRASLSVTKSLLASLPFL